MTLTARAKKDLLKLGYTHVETVEHYDQRTQRRHDLLGFGDLLALHPPFGLVLIQVTTRTNHAHRRRKIESLEIAKTWRRCGGGILLMSYRKKGARWEYKMERL